MMIDENNPVRVINPFVDSVDLKTFGFEAYEENNRGQRPYQREDLLKIVIYSYMNKIRSSRSIEQECKRNIELMWLTGGITSDHGTIFGFIKENKGAVKELFKSYVLFLKGLALIDGKLIAIDGTKIRASNAKTNIIIRIK
ncbi:MAG: transposase [Clostridiales bacterium]|nr:transposase [Clostridiales bacterium]